MIRQSFNAQLRELDVLSAIWILASNDRIPLITYKGIAHRLFLTRQTEVRPLVLQHGELFRRVTNPAALQAWKAEMLSGYSSPTWISAISDPAEREKAISSLSVDDVFRSQFRVEPKSPPSPIDVIRWGMDHIDAQRRALLERRKDKWRAITALAPLLVLLVTVLLQTITLSKTLASQSELKKLELSSRPKHDGYARFMTSTLQAFDAASKHDSDALRQKLDSLEAAYYSIEPFLGSRRDSIWQQLQQLAAMCNELARDRDLTTEKRSKYADSFFWYRQFFRDQLYEPLLK
jgi:hypothetical protein